MADNIHQFVIEETLNAITEKMKEIKLLVECSKVSHWEVHCLSYEIITELDVVEDADKSSFVKAVILLQPFFEGKLLNGVITLEYDLAESMLLKTKEVIKLECVNLQQSTVELYASAKAVNNRKSLVDKFAALVGTQSNAPTMTPEREDAIRALTNLGYNKKEATKAVQDLATNDPSIISTQDIVYAIFKNK